MKLEDCIPTNKSDTDAAEKATAAGYPAVNAILPALLEWVQDGNWPVTGGIFDLLAQAGPEIAPHINAIFDGDDEEWKWYILYGLVGNLRPDVAALVKTGVERMARNPTAAERVAEVDGAAGDVLLEWSRPAK